MSVFQLLRPLPATRRAYSFFSKPGGGRYFNSAKPPKVVTATNIGKVDPSSPANASGDTSSNVVTKDEELSSGSSISPDGSSSRSVPSPIPFAMHPPINSQALKLHQFFSLHRPLLLHQPTDNLFESTTSFNMPPSSEPANMQGVDETPEPSPEADADAARQLARALVVNHVGASLAWEATLKRLGLDETKGRAEEVSLAEEEFQIYMDSTKRKRRKKMKKHKLKKRRRLTRASRLNTR